MSRRGGTPMRGAPSLEAANQHQIEDLVQRNRTLEHTNKKLSEQLALEVARSKDAVSEIQEQWKLSERQWREGCDELLACHRLVQQHTVVDLERERTNVLKEQELLRKEKLQRLQRDYRIMKFQAREAELEDRISGLEEEKEELVMDYEAVVNRLKEKCVEYAAYAKIKEKEVVRRQQQYEELEGRLNKLLETNANLQASSEAKASKLERVALQYDGAQTRCAELERSNDELKRTNGELSRQLDKWQSLETKGGEEAEVQRRKRIELDLELKTTKERLQKLEEKEGQELAREKRRVDKMKLTVQEWEEEAGKQQREAEDAAKQLAKATKQLEKLKAELEVERVRVKPLSPEKLRIVTSNTTEEDEDEVANEIEVVEPPTSRRELKPPSRTAAKPNAARSRQPTAIPESENEAGPSRTAKKEKEPDRKRKVKRNELESEVEEVDVDVEEPPPKLKSRPKPKAKAAPVPAADSEVEEAEVPKKSKGKAKAVAEDISEPPPTTNKGKRKARDDDEDEDEIVGAGTGTAKKGAKGAGKPRRGTARAGSRAASVQPGDATEGDLDSDTRKTAKKPRKGTTHAGGSRAASIQPAAAVDVDAYEEEDAAPKKKKRKINIFPSTAGGMEFDFMGTGGSGGGLEIPTVLSPVKESDNVPMRSTTGSIVGSLGSMGSMLKNRITGRK